MNYEWIHDKGTNSDGEFFNDWLMVLDDGRIPFMVQVPNNGNAYNVAHRVSYCYAPTELWFYGEDAAKRYCEDSLGDVLRKEREHEASAEQRSKPKRGVFSRIRTAIKGR